MAERGDRNDKVQAAEQFLNLKRCPGGRIVVDGYVCMHCGRDYTVQGTRCGSPRRKSKSL